MKTTSISTLFFILYYIASSPISAMFSTNKNTFSVTDYGAVGDGNANDTQAFLKAWKDVCAAEGDTTTLIVPIGRFFLLNSILFEGPCNSKAINFEVMGTLVATTNVEEWTGHDYDKWIQFSGIKGLGLNGKYTGVINGMGSYWWGVHSERPTAMHFNNCENLWVSGTKHMNSARNHMSICGCNGVDIYNVHIAAPHDSPNTDGIDISGSTYVKIHSSWIGTGDDCIAINTGSSFINITGISCGPGHGISIGSLGRHGEESAVEEVLVRNCSFHYTKNGARIKTWQGGSGYARKITFEDISFTDTENPIIIDQFYNDHVLGEKKAASSAVHVSDVIFRHIYGTSSTEEAIKLNCNDQNGCDNIILSDVNIVSSNPEKTKVHGTCHNAQGRSRSTTPSVPCLS